MTAESAFASTATTVPATDGPLPGPDLRTLLELHHEGAFGWALHCCGRAAATEAENVLQMAYLEILEGRARFDGRSAFKTWLFGVIRLQAAAERRRLWRREFSLRRLLEGGFFSEALRPPAPSPAMGLHAAQRTAMLQAALAQLPARQQEVMHLVFYEEMTLPEVAATLGISAGSVSQHYDRGKRRLKELLEDV